MQLNRTAALERLAEIDALLRDLDVRRGTRALELRRSYNRSQLLGLADQIIGTHSLRGTGPRNRANAGDIAVAIAMHENPASREERRLELERNRLRRELEH